MFGTLDSSEIEQLINTQFIGRIGCHADGITYVVPVSYAYDGTYVYCLGYEGKKIDMMRKNPKVCFQVDDTRNLANWQSVVAWGDYEEITNPSDRAKALQKLNDRKLPEVTSSTMKLSPQWPFIPDNLEDVKGIVFRIGLEQKTGRFEKTTSDNFFAS
ncbi:pyridoxamine 5'-phosphate oxidase family protein [Flavihumibacter fluvii]|jgi:uncharacterized protein|uniref:pyridoxamine 5'-phosphate oxidase family protein n=1 Tax=Flavihumibacter fluvii TaxID=2838157 RepID=UPI001BDE56B0|nr:pyridoxamine 5'-phosphate oxidase family protein [Flavihumibacter fluvii]ULQ53820.1 pyridoxamine 5'-phosphate oxidase family protein [Flavihumibacter fluvii]